LKGRFDMRDSSEQGSGLSGNPLAGSMILVVDDDEDIRTFLLALFADHGASLCEAEDGNEAIEMARTKKPDLITLDLSMPGRDGVSTFCALREDPETRTIPVCIVTGHPEFRKVIYDRPASPPDGFVHKPVDPDELVRTVRRILALRSRRDKRQS
jgi:CheY-like chemotaxis protein